MARESHRRLERKKGKTTSMTGPPNIRTEESTAIETLAVAGKKMGKKSKKPKPTSMPFARIGGSGLQKGKDPKKKKKKKNKKTKKQKPAEVN